MFGIPNFSGDMGGDPFEDRLDVVRAQEDLEDEEELVADDSEFFDEDVYDPWHDLDLGMPGD